MAVQPPGEGILPGVQAYRIGAGESTLRPRKSQKDLRISDVKRLGRLGSAPNVSFEDNIREALRGTG